jgi:hypothetical protein
VIEDGDRGTIMKIWRWKYQQEFEACREDRKKFIIVCVNKYKVKRRTVGRQFYDLRIRYKKLSQIKEKEKEKVIDNSDILPRLKSRAKVVGFSAHTSHKIIGSEELQTGYSEYSKDDPVRMKQPDALKMIKFRDLLRYYGKVVISDLYKYGFYEDEINWLKKNLVEVAD